MIITTTSTDNLNAPVPFNFPDQFLSEKYKTTNTDWIKATMDFFKNSVFAEYRVNKDTIAKNYRILKGELIPEDYVEVDYEEVGGFIHTLSEDIKMPKWVKHYPIINPPINEMLGGLSKRKISFRAKALDDLSGSEELEEKTQMMWSLIMQKVQQEVMLQLQNSGELEQLQQEKDPQKLQQAQQQINDEINQKAQDYLIDYTSTAEKWANHIIQAMRTELNLKEISEEMLKDLLVCSRPYTLIDEDNSKRGFTVESINPKNVKRFGSEDKKYSRDDYAVAIVNVMEISEIIEKFDLTKEEIDHLRTSYNDYTSPLNIPSNYGHTTVTGPASVKYTRGSRLIDQERAILAAEVGGEDTDEYMQDIFNFGSPNPGVMGYKYVVVRAFWNSKKLIKKVTFTDEDGITQTVLVDETYKEGSIPTEISVEEGWINQWFKGYTVGPDIYYVKPFNLLNYCPLIGGTFDQKNSKAASLVDMMKSFQLLYNVVINQLYSFLGKDKGKVIKIDINKIPIPKDGDPQDAIEVWLRDAQERGIVFEDNSPSNTKVPLHNTEVSQALDLDLSQSIQTRIELAQELKYECYELVGFTRQRLATPTPGDTATANQNALNISYTQTEPYYIQHRYIMNQLYQAIVDAAQYIESSKPSSTLSYLNDKGESAFIQVTPKDIRGRDINVYVTSSDEDDQVFKQLQSLSQAVLQNEGTLYDVVQLYTTNSLKTLERVLKSLSDKRTALQQQQLQNEQDQIKSQQQATAATLQAQEIEKDKERDFDANQNDLDRLNKKEVALIQSYGRNDNALADNNNDGIADALEVTKEQNAVNQYNKDYQLKSKETDIKERQRQDSLLIELQKIATEREKLQTQLKIAKLALQNPVSGETKPKSKSKK